MIKEAIEKIVIKEDLKMPTSCIVCPERLPRSKW